MDKKRKNYVARKLRVNKAILCLMIVILAFTALMPFLSIKKAKAEEIYIPLSGNLVTQHTVEKFSYSYPAPQEIVSGHYVDIPKLGYMAQDIFFDCDVEIGAFYKLLMCFNSYPASVDFTLSFFGTSFKGRDLFNKKIYVKATSKSFRLHYGNHSSFSLKGEIILKKVEKRTPEGEQLKPQFLSANYATKGQYVRGGSSENFAEIAVSPNLVYILDLNNTDGDIAHFDVEFDEYEGRFFKTYGQLIFKTKGESFKLRVNTECEFFPTLRTGLYEDVEKAENFMYESLRDLNRPPEPEPEPPKEENPTDKGETPTDKPSIDVPTDSPDIDKENGFVKFFENMGKWFTDTWGKVSLWFKTTWFKVSTWFETTFVGWFKGGNNG